MISAQIKKLIAREWMFFLGGLCVGVLLMPCFIAYYHFFDPMALDWALSALESEQWFAWNYWLIYGVILLSCLRMTVWSIKVIIKGK